MLHIGWLHPLLVVATCVTGGGVGIRSAVNTGPIAIAPASQVVGCYQLELGPWLPLTPIRALIDIPEGTYPPAIVELTCQCATGHDELGAGYMVLPRFSSRYHLFQSTWHLRSAREVEIWWTTGFGGLQVVAHPSDGQLVGIARFWSDDISANEPHQESVTTLTPISCPHAWWGVRTAGY